MVSIKDRYYNFLGIIKRAGKIVAGYDTVKDNFRKAHLIILAENASEKLKQKIKRKCEDKGLNLICFGNSENYGRSLGMKDTVILAILDKNFSEALMNKFGFEVLTGGEKFGKS